MPAGSFLELPLARSEAKPLARHGGLRFSEAVALLTTEQTRDQGAALRGATLDMHTKVYRLFTGYAGDPQIGGDAQGCCRFSRQGRGGTAPIQPQLAPICGRAVGRVFYAYQVC